MYLDLRIIISKSLCSLACRPIAKLLPIKVASKSVGGGALTSPGVGGLAAIKRGGGQESASGPATKVQRTEGAMVASGGSAKDGEPIGGGLGGLLGYSDSDDDDDEEEEEKPTTTTSEQGRPSDDKAAPKAILPSPNELLSAHTPKSDDLVVQKVGPDGELES